MVIALDGDVRVFLFYFSSAPLSQPAVSGNLTLRQ